MDDCSFVGPALVVNCSPPSPPMASHYRHHHHSPTPPRTLPSLTAEQLAALKEMADFVEQGKFSDPGVGFLCGGPLLSEVGACVCGLRGEEDVVV